MTYLQEFLDTPIPQTEALPGQVPNSDVGFSFPVDDMTRLQRFLVLGSEGGSYYAKQRELTKENAEAVRRCIESRGIETVTLIREMALTGRVPKMGPPLFALAMAASYGSEEVRAHALAVMPDVARTASHLFQFVQYIDGMRGWGRGLRNAVSKWYSLWPFVSQAVYQTVKYRQRNDWSHRDLLRKSHPVVDGELNDLFQWVTQGTMPPVTDTFELVHAYEQAKEMSTEELPTLIREHNMTWEMIPATMMNEPEVLRALFERMPLMAMVRNLASLTNHGILVPFSEEVSVVVERLNQIGADAASLDTEDEGFVSFGRLHPIQLLSALTTYKSGRGIRGQLTWDPVPQIVDALDGAFERSFAQAPRTGQRLYLAIDVSPSMSSGMVAGVPGISPRMGAAALAVAMARKEPNYYIAGFSSVSRGISFRYNPIMAPLHITAKDTFDVAMTKTTKMPMGGTDCSLPMLDALEKRMPVDCFVILTDSETHSGSIHPSMALQKYREEMEIPAKMVVVGMVGNGFTIADPNDAGMLDVVGFDSAVPQLIADFTRPRKHG